MSHQGAFPILSIYLETTTKQKQEKLINLVPFTANK